jgi:hypothetical protein
MAISLVIDFGELVKIALKREAGKEWVCGGSCLGAAGFCGPSVYMGVFLL